MSIRIAGIMYLLLCKYNSTKIYSSALYFTEVHTILYYVHCTLSTMLLSSILRRGTSRPKHQQINREDGRLATMADNARLRVRVVGISLSAVDPSLLTADDSLTSTGIILFNFTNLKYFRRRHR